MTGGYAVILIRSSTHAFHAETFLHSAGIETRLIPVPRHLSSRCGVCVRIARSDREHAREVLESHGPKFEDICDI